MRPLVLAALLLLSACATQKSEPPSLYDSLGVPDPFVRSPNFEAQLAAAARHPLGSRENPVRADMPQGQHGYLRRLRCSDGAPPAFERVGSHGIGPFGGIIDEYRVECANGEPKRASIFMDLYHRGYAETAAPPGFTTAP